MIVNPIAPFYSYLIALYSIIPLPILAIIYCFFGVNFVADVLSYFNGGGG